MVALFFVRFFKQAVRRIILHPAFYFSLKMRDDKKDEMKKKSVKAFVGIIYGVWTCACFVF